ncbi:hypothetical protein EV363DRAFT_1167449 [Boletus edulis]|nr:hypothetical protein EV363DRAFT_1167449 [Boletus edulis]
MIGCWAGVDRSTCAMFLWAARRDGEWVRPCRMAVFFAAFPAQLILRRTTHTVRHALCSLPGAETFAYNAPSGLPLTGGVTLAPFLDMVYVKVS